MVYSSRSVRSPRRRTFEVTVARLAGGTPTSLGLPPSVRRGRCVVACSSGLTWRRMWKRVEGSFRFSGF